MAGPGETPSSENPSPPQAPVVTEGANGAPVVPEKPSVEGNVETTSQQTQEAIDASNRHLTTQRARLRDAREKEGADADIDTDLRAEFPDFDPAPLLPPLTETPGSGGLPQIETTPPNFVELSEVEKQENHTAEAIRGKMDAELESVTKNGNIDQLPAEIQSRIRTEVVRTSIDPNLLPEEVKSEILATMRGSDGKPLLDLDNVDLTNLTQYQKEYILNSEKIRQMSLDVARQCQILYNEAKRRGEKKIDGALLVPLREQLGLPTDDALILSQLEGATLSDYPSNSQIGIVQRVLSESTFNDLRNILSDGMKWSHVPDRVKREIAINSFNAESDQNTPEIRQAILDARSELARAAYDVNPAESTHERNSRLKSRTGISQDSTDIEALSLEARKSGLSPAMRALCDFFGPIGAALGMPFWQEYMGQGIGQDETVDTSDRYMTGDGNNEYTGEVGEQSPELAKNGFKGDVMNSIWRWEYQPGKEAEVVPAGKSGLTLCGGIDLAYTPYNKVQSIFQGILKPETIEKIRPFCDNGRRGPIRGTAEALLNSKPGLKAEIESQLNPTNMGEAFTRSLAIDWQRLVNKHGEVVKNAPGYIQVFMLSRFYHAGIGGSASIIRDVIASGFNHSSVVSIAENFRNTRSEGYYKNRMNKEIAYLKSSPPDAKPAVESPQLNTDIAVARQLGDYVANIVPPKTGSESCGAAVGEILNNFGYANLLPQEGRHGKHWDDFLDELVLQGYFQKVPCSDPAQALPGGVLVYNGGPDVGGSNANKEFGHVEIKSSDGKYVHYTKSDLPGGSARYSENKGFGGYVYYPVSLPNNRNQYA